MKAVLLQALAIIGILAGGACTGQVKEQDDPAGNAPALSVYLVNHGWHTGIVFRRADIARAIWPEADDFPTAEYLEVGWGDSDYYQSRNPGAWLALKAALWPTPSVLCRAPARTSTLTSRNAALALNKVCTTPALVNVTAY